MTNQRASSFPVKTESPSGVLMEIVNPCSDRLWDEDVLRHEEVTVFHASAWAKVLVDTYGHKPSYLSFSRGQELVALVPMMDLSSWPKGRRGVGLPFSDFCSPLLFVEDAVQHVREGLESVGRIRAWRYIEIREAMDSLSSGGEGDLGSFVGHELSLEKSDEDQFARLDSAAQRSVRKAGRSGLTVAVSESWASMKTFFHLHEKTRRRHGVPPQPLSFFRHIQASLMASGKGFVTLVEKEGQAVAGAVFLFCGKRAVYKFGASDENFLGDRPNHLAIWKGIQSLILRGCASLHFGRTSLGQEGLRRFKRSWGAREVGLSYMRYNPQKDQWFERSGGSSPACMAGLRFIPLPMSRLAGRILYPHLD